MIDTVNIGMDVLTSLISYGMGTQARSEVHLDGPALWKGIPTVPRLTCLLPLRDYLS